MPSTRRLAERLLLEQARRDDETQTSAGTTSLSWSSTDDCYPSLEAATTRLLDRRGPPGGYGPGLIYPHPPTSSRPTGASHAQARGAGRAPRAEVASDAAAPAPAPVAEGPEGPSSAEEQGKKGQETKRDRNLRRGHGSDLAVVDPELQKHAYSLRWHLSCLTEEGLERERRKRFGTEDDVMPAQSRGSEGAGTRAEASLRGLCGLRSLPRRPEHGLKTSSGQAVTACHHTRGPWGASPSDGSKQDEQEETEWEFVGPDSPPGSLPSRPPGRSYDITAPAVIGVVAASSAVAAMGAMWRFAYNG